MEKIYLDPKNPGSFGGVKRLREAANVSEKLAKEFLETRDEYSVNKEARKRFRRNPIVVTSLQQQYQIDLADMSRYKQQNNGTAYLLVAVDCFSRKVSVQPMKKKTGEETLEALKKVFADLGEPDKLQADKGKEFYNTTVQDYLKERQVILFSSENADIKCAMAERFIRTLKTRIWRLFRHRQNTVYIDKLQDIVTAYNNSTHAAHGLRPNDIRHDNSLTAFEALYKDMLKSRSPKFKTGDAVRISKQRGVFDKGYAYPFKEEVFTIEKVIRHAVPVYELKTWDGLHIHGKFYEPELSLVRNHDPNKAYPIEKILRRRGNKVLVRYLGYDKSHDAWINESDLQGA